MYEKTAPWGAVFFAQRFGLMLKPLASNLKHFRRPTAFNRLAAQAHNLGLASTQSHQDFA
ncbi:MAG: hypothetical protein V4709_10980 [Pseudomonadota bacterium]